MSETLESPWRILKKIDLYVCLASKYEESRIGAEGTEAGAM